MHKIGAKSVKMPIKSAFWWFFTEKLSILSQMPQMPQKGIWVSLRLIWLSRFYYFLLRFLRDTPLPLADAADAAERYMGLTQIDLIIQIYYFLLRFPRETTNPLADGADDAERYMGLTQIDLIKQSLIFSSAISARNYQSSRRWRRCRRKSL